MIILKYNDNFSESKFRRAGNVKKETFCCSFMEWQQKKMEKNISQTVYVQYKTSFNRYLSEKRCNTKF